MADIFSASHFRHDNEARKFLEGILWPEGPICPHCGTFNHAYKTKREGVYRCASKECRKDFTVTQKTIMERSHIALHKWLQAFHLMCSSKKGVSAHQLHRTLDIHYQSAWFMAHRIRECMRAGGLNPVTPLGGEGKVVEADETYFGRAKTKRLLKPRTTPYTKGGWKNKGAARPIIALVERGGTVRTFHVSNADKVTVTKIVRENVARESRLHTDESALYKGSDEHFAAHETVHHSSGEYARGDVNTNSAEGYFSIFKRGMKGVYQHCDEKHLHRYLAEYDFRYNHRTALGFEDTERAALALKGAAGKRLTYRQPH
jgi:transposase-like protein